MHKLGLLLLDCCRYKREKLFHFAEKSNPVIYFNFPVPDQKVLPVLDLPSCNIRGNVHREALKQSSCELQGGDSCSISLLRLWAKIKKNKKFLTCIPVTFRACKYVSEDVS